MKWTATLANFFLPGLGYLLGVPRKRPQAVLWLLGALGLTYVEQVALGPGHAAFWPMFAAVFVLNSAFAINTYRELTPAHE